MLERKQILPVGSRITVCFASDGGKETFLVVVGHLSLKRAMMCYYDYVCVPYPAGMDEGLIYVNHTDVVRVLTEPEIPDDAYDRWLARKYPEYVAYYENGKPEERPDIDTMRATVLNARDREHRKNRIRRIVRTVCGALCVLGVGFAVLLTKRWEIATGALFFSLLGVGINE